ncbi:MAG: alpha/beta hydrolase [Anaerolineae bacterium]|nr:alpha/beta hydrolase [Anaerolineae bacterium]
MPYADLSTGARLHYLDTGEADKPIIVLLHGLLGTASMHFPQVIEWLRPRFRVIGPSLRGYGQSTPKPRTFAPDFYDLDALDVLAFLDALHIDRCHILGYSDGGETALVAAGRAPQRFASVATIGATGFLSPIIRERAQNGMGDGSWITEQERALHGIDDPAAFVQAWKSSFVGMIDAGGDLSLRNADKLTAPTLLLLGDRDGLNPIEAAEVYVAKAANARAVLVPACGHPVHDDQWDVFVREMDAHFVRAGVN